MGAGWKASRGHLFYLLAPKQYNLGIPKSLTDVCLKRLLPCWGKVQSRPLVSGAAEHVKMDFQIKVATNMLDVRVKGHSCCIEPMPIAVPQMHVDV